MSALTEQGCLWVVQERDREWEREREEARARDRESGATPADRDAALNVSGDEAFARRGRYRPKISHTLQFFVFYFVGARTLLLPCRAPSK